MPCGHTRGILAFELPQERTAFRDAQKGAEYRFVLCDMDEQLRRIVKYGEDEQHRDFAQGIRDRLQTELDARGLSLEDEF